MLIFPSRLQVKEYEERALTAVESELAVSPQQDGEARLQAEEEEEGNSHKPQPSPASEA